MMPAVGLILMVLAVHSHAGIVPQLPAVALSQIPNELLPFDPGGVLDRVPVFISDTEPYASFFIETAMVHGTLAIADSLTSQFVRTLEEAAAGAYEVSQSDPGQWADVVERVLEDRNTRPDALASLEAQRARLERLQGPLLALGDRVPHLIGQATSLTQAASSDFPGWRGKVKLARHLNALRVSAEQLHAAATSSVRTGKNVEAIVHMLKP